MNGKNGYCYPNHGYDDPAIEKAMPVVIVNMGGPGLPRIERTIPGPWPALYGQLGSSTNTIALPALPGLSPQQRLEVHLRQFWKCGWENIDVYGVVVTLEEGLPVTWRLTQLDEKTATFDRIGRAEDTPLVRLVKAVGWRGWSDNLLVHNGYAYVSYSNNRQENLGIDVYDLHDPAHPRNVGHFAAPDDVIGSMVPLPNGRVLVTGYRLYVLAPPR